MSEIHGYMCGPREYKYDGWYFEFSNYNGPHPLKKNGALMKTITKDFWDMWEKFSKLKDKQKEKYRVGGGCVKF